MRRLPCSEARCGEVGTVPFRPLLLLNPAGCRPHTKTPPPGATNEGAVVQESFACPQRWTDAERISGNPTIHDLENALCARPQPSPTLNGAADFGWIGCQAFASIRSSAEACFGAGLVAAGAFHKSARTRRERFRSRSIQVVLRNLAAMLGCSRRAAPERCLREVGATEVDRGCTYEPLA